jgi:ribonuclease HI
MLITMFTDASYSSTLKRATWAVWFRCDGTTHRRSGYVKHSVTQSGDGEIAAIVNGMHQVYTVLNPPPGSKLIIQTDSAEAIHAYRCGNHVRPYCNQVIAYGLRLTASQRWVLDFRHVKGHKGTQTPRNAVNTWCDGECRRLMGRLILEAKGKTTNTLAEQYSLVLEQKELKL